MAGSNRLRRAQQLRQQRKNVSASASSSKGGTGGSNSGADGDDVMVVSGVFTLFCAFAIVCVGAGIATVFFMIHEPECMKAVVDSTIPQPAARLRRLEKPNSNDNSSLHPNPNHPSVLTPSVVEETAQEQLKEIVNEEATPAVEAKQATPTVVIKHTNQASAKPATATNNFVPSQCTPEQLSVVARQLPAAGCERNKNLGWKRIECSFSAATGCSDPLWLKNFFYNYFDDSAEQQRRLTAVIVGCNKGYQALEWLGIASHDLERYDWKNWRNVFLSQGSSDAVKIIGDDAAGKQCPRQDPTATTASSSSMVGRPAKAYCLEPIPTTYQHLVKTKKALDVPDDRLEIEELALMDVQENVQIPLHADVGSSSGISSWQAKCGDAGSNGNTCKDIKTDLFDHWIRDKKDMGRTDPIHYLSLDLEGHDYQVIEGAMKSLDRTWYLDLSYHWTGDWANRSLEELIQRLQGKGMVCYFTGNENNLWRITDCWQDHYQYHFWSRIGCVNTQIEQVQPLVRTMEDLFLETQEKSISFGKA